MRARSQRTHLMGKSNRQISDSLQKTKSIHQRSFNKSSILQKSIKINPQMSAKLSQSLMLNKSKLKQARQNPFNGTNVELQSARYDKMNVKTFRYMQDSQKARPYIGKKDYSDRVNQRVKHIKQEYDGKNINTHKLFYLKQAILKNNRDRVHFRQYFDQFVNNKITNQITNDGLKAFIKSYGYDLNNQEISLFMKLNINKKIIYKQQNNSHQLTSINNLQQINIDMKDFIQICTKDNIYLKTINLHQKQKHKISHKTFQAKHFQILRNKFNKLKQAFKIYQNRNQSVNYDKFNKTMKKLDITDLIMIKPQRDQLFYRFSDDNGIFNPQKFIGAIAAHYHQQKHQAKQKTGFQTNLKFIQEQQAQKEKRKQSQYNLKKSSVIQYEKHLQNARIVLNQLRDMASQQNQKQKILKSIISGNDSINKIQLRQKLETYLMSNGHNFRPQKYQSLIGYFDFDSHGYITKKEIQRFIYNQTDKQAEARIQRQTRNLPPINRQINLTENDLNAYTAAKTLKLLKQATLNPQVSTIFSSFDKDKDGYISKVEFKNKLRQILVKQSDINIENLSRYFYEDKNHLTRDEFMKKYPLDQHYEIENSRMKSKSYWEYNDLRKSQIYQLKKSKLYRPSKYSAWPDHLHEHNLSLIQAPKHSGIHIQQRQRFNNSQKHYYGLEQKLERHRKRNMKIAKMSTLNKQRQQHKNKQFQDLITKQQNKNFKVRLVRQQYHHNLIENYD